MSEPDRSYDAIVCGGSFGGRSYPPLLVDGRNFLDAEAVRAAGLTYDGIGRPAVGADA